MNSDQLISLLRLCAGAQRLTDIQFRVLDLLIAGTQAAGGLVYEFSGADCTLRAARCSGIEGGMPGDLPLDIPGGDLLFEELFSGVSQPGGLSGGFQSAVNINFKVVDNLTAEPAYISAVSQFWIQTAATHGWKSLVAVGFGSTRIVLFGATKAQFHGEGFAANFEPAVQVVAVTSMRVIAEEKMHARNADLQHLNSLHQALMEQQQLLFDAPAEVDLFEGVCRRLHETGLFDLVGIGWPDADGQLRYHHAVGSHAKELMETFATPVAGSAGGGTLSREVMRTGKIQISNDYQHDIRSTAYHETARRLRINAWAALPIVCEGKTWGVLGVISGKRGVFRDAISTLLASSAALLGRTLERRRLVDRLQSKQSALTRLNTLYTAILEESKLILTAASEHDLLQGTCDALVATGPFCIVGIGWPDEQGMLHYHFGGGPSADEVRHCFSFSIHEEPVTLSAKAWQSQSLEFSNDYAADPRSRGFSSSSAARYIKSIAVIPIRRGGNIWGLISVVANQVNFLDGDILALVRNCSMLLGSALDALDMRARVNRLSSLYKSLSGQGQIILQKHDENGLCRGIAEQLADCGLFSTISILRPDAAGWLARIVVAGRGKEELMKVRINIHDDRRMSLVRKAWKENRLCFANQIQREENVSATRDTIVAIGGHAVAAAPIMRANRQWGILSLISPHAQLFDVEISGLVESLVGQLGRALDEIDLRHRLDAELSQQAWLAAHDVLTGLPNRSMMDENITRAVARAERAKSLMAVAVLDVNDFKPINDTLGHAAGDEFLKQLAARIRAALRKTDCAHRLGGDEFVMVLEDLTMPADAEAFFRRITAELDRPYQLKGFGEIRAPASIGYTIFPALCPAAANLLARADAALYVAKQNKGDATRWVADTADAADRRENPVVRQPQPNSGG